MSEVISGQFPAIFTLENIFQVLAMEGCDTVLTCPCVQACLSQWTNKLLL